jgi:hypothetical protein
VANLTSHEPSLEDVFLTYYRPDGGEPVGEGRSAAGR